MLLILSCLDWVCLRSRDVNRVQRGSEQLLGCSVGQHHYSASLDNAWCYPRLRQCKCREDCLSVLLTPLNKSVFGHGILLEFVPWSAELFVELVYKCAVILSNLMVTLKTCLDKGSHCIFFILA